MMSVPKILAFLQSLDAETGQLFMQFLQAAAQHEEPNRFVQEALRSALKREQTVHIDVSR